MSLPTSSTFATKHHYGDETRYIMLIHILLKEMEVTLVAALVITVDRLRTNDKHYNIIH